MRRQLGGTAERLGECLDRGRKIIAPEHERAAFYSVMMCPAHREAVARVLERVGQVAAEVAALGELAERLALDDVMRLEGAVARLIGEHTAPR